MQPHLKEDTNHIWRQLCYSKFGAKSCESVEGSGESWKEGFTRLTNENNAKLNFLAKKISKKKEKEEKSNLKSKLAFVQGHVKAPRHVQAAQMRVRSNLWILKPINIFSMGLEMILETKNMMYIFQELLMNQLKDTQPVLAR